MSYSAEISRQNPSCFLFLIDQSGSMEDEISVGDDTATLANGVADTINSWLQELSIKCAKSDGVRDYYDICVLGYGSKVGSGFVGPLAGREMIPISEIADNPARLEERTRKVPDGTGGIIEQSVRIPVWFEPLADGGTPMCQAAHEARRILQGWIQEHPNAFPPTVIHITDGESTDGNPTDKLQELTQLTTADGNVMLFNIHLSVADSANTLTFLDSDDVLPDLYSRMLFDTASHLTPSMRMLAREHGFNTNEESRCFVMNGDLVLLVQAIDIGTRPSNNHIDAGELNGADEIPLEAMQDSRDDWGSDGKNLR